MMKFIESLELKNSEIVVQREKSNNIFEKVDEASLEADSLLKYRVLLKGIKCTKYEVNDLVLISADKVRKIKTPECPDDVVVIYNEELIFAKIKE